MSKRYLRPTGFVDAPFGHDGKVARLAGGLQWFSAVELHRTRTTAIELVPVAGIEDAARRRPAAQAIWQRI